LRVDLERYRTAHRALSWRSVLLIGIGSVGVVLSSFGVLLGVLLLVMPEGGLWENRAGFVVTFFCGAFPLIGSVLAVWRGFLARQRLARFRELAALARHTPTFRAEDVSRTLQVGPQLAERVVLEAATLGFLSDDGGATGPRPAFADTVAQTALTLPPGADGRDPAQWVGAVLHGTWCIEALLGSGGMGAVYRARHVRTGRHYAVKTLLPDVRLSPDAVRRFAREAAAASSLGHAHIVAVHDFHETPEGIHYLVMDLLQGETLERRLSRVGSLPWHEAQRIALELASALCSAHDRGLLHRDLKPSNVLLAQMAGAPERAMLLDFGLAKPLDDASATRLTQTGAPVGTPLYMSPEQARGEPVDVRTDVYGLGAVLYEMVTGAPPFFDRTLAAVYARLLTESAAAPSRLARAPLPPGADPLLERALAKRAADRFSDMRAFAGALSAVGSSASVAHARA
jgi:tRNA A-37 threonylcarbamoyl transferase component Bud32